MRIEKIGNRGVFFTFEEGDSMLPADTGVYLIQSDKRMFLCDTHLGPKSMDVVKEYIHEHGLGGKELIIFNSHADWDHIWGNNAFGDVTIVAHQMCKKEMEERGQQELEKYLNKYHDGSVVLKMPNLTFDSQLKFEEDELEFIYAPGHTLCSALCYDRRDSVLFVGDLVEAPHPYLNCDALETYIETLELIKEFPAEILLSSHSGVVDRQLVDENIAFIKKAMEKNEA